ncbi:hypothetical protein A9G24_02495 [Gilliamella sp. App6-5]|uniref:hypothetical protein n=1 Tax=Gilliamella sp. App6-5 TaxID=3120232 RepID=UPI00080EE65E|nr:hypothetical protein [Gilliamella apicola]OCG17976.1 hypothetical protein A9G24_02495 [Gilliamella apicola]
MKKFITLIFLYGVLCGNSVANITKYSFKKYPVEGSNGKLIEYKSQLNETFSFSFFVDTKNKTAVPVISDKLKKYQAVSVRFCVDETSDCWRVPIYGDLLNVFVDNINNKQNVWDIEFIDKDKLLTTGIMSIPQLGDLSNYAGIDETDYDGLLPYIIWQSDVKVYE